MNTLKRKFEAAQFWDQTCKEYLSQVRTLHATFESKITDSLSENKHTRFLNILQDSKLAGKGPFSWTLHGHTILMSMSGGRVLFIQIGHSRDLLTGRGVCTADPGKGN